MNPKIKIIVIFLIAFIVYFFSASGTTPYNYFTRLADAFLHGKYYITENPPWLSELIPLTTNKFAVVYPPMPAFLALPFVAIFGRDFPQQILAHILGAAIVCFTYLISLRIKEDKKLALWSGVLVGFGSILWFMSATGSVWLVGQLTSAFFMTVALYEALSKKRLIIIAICFGSMYLSRPHTILAFPLFLYLLKDKIFKLKNILIFGFSITPFFMFDFAYNFIRYGSIFNKGYFLLPALLGETKAPWFINGVENISYIPNNLRTIFASFPKVINKFPYLTPSWNGLALWITSPAFVFALFNNIKVRVVQVSWVSIFLISLVIFGHGGNGFAQFGYRFAVDFYPILIFLTIKSVAKTGLKKIHWVLLILSIFVNLWGVILINKLNLVSF